MSPLDRSRRHRTGLLGAWLLAAALSPAAAQEVARLSVVADQRVGKAQQVVPGCPNNGGLLDSVSVPVNQPLDLRLVIGVAAPAGGVTYQLRSDDPSIVAAGDRVQGFLPVVTIPAGQTQSNSFRVFGILVGKTTLRSISQTAGFASGATPITAWDLNPGAPVDKKFVDANPPANFCRSGAASVAFSTDPSVIARCGKNVEGISADGQSRLLLRVGAGLTGTACFEITSTSSDDQGTLNTSIASLAAFNNLLYAGAYLTAPKNYGSNGESRQIEAEVTYTSNIGNSNTSRIRFKTLVVRPPVVLVHGLWGNVDSFSEWATYQPEGDFRTILSANYGGTNAAAFAANRAVLRPFVNQALDRHRRRFATTQVDVVSHSMGGIVSRLHIGSATFKTPQNLNQGDVRRLMTLVTPHYGASFANLLVALHRANAADTARVVRDVAGGNVVGGAVCDLSENSTGLQLGELNAGASLRSQVYTGTGGPAGTPAAPAQFFGGRLGRGNFEGALTERRCSRMFLGICTERLGPFLFPQATVDAFRFRQANDTVVPQTSQLGGQGAAGANFPGVIHSGGSGLGGLVTVEGMTNSRPVATAAFALLDGADTGFAAALGGVLSTGGGEPRTVPGRGVALDMADYANQCGAGGPLAGVLAGDSRLGKLVSVANPGLTMLSPANGAALQSGGNVALVGQFSASFEPSELGFTLGGGLGYVDATARNGAQFQLGSYALPSDLAGPVLITPVARDADGNLVEGVPITVVVVPPAPLVALNLLQSDFQVLPGAAPQQLILKGSFGAPPATLVTDVTAFGASFTSSNAAVVSVGTGGLVNIVGPGLATVTASYGGLGAFATFIVEDPAMPLPPQDLSSQIDVAASGFQLNRVSGFYVQTLTLTNRSQTVLPSPLFLTINGLSTGVTLVGTGVGATTNIAPAGTSFVGVPAPAQRLVPGQSVSVQLQFLNPGRARIAYQPKLFWTDAQP